jgi:hypothetical protein
MAHITTKMQLPEFNSLLKHLAGERALSTLSSQNTEHENLIRPRPTANHQYTLGHPYSLPSSPTTTSVVQPVKSKRSKREHSTHMCNRTPSTVQFRIY